MATLRAQKRALRKATATALRALSSADIQVQSQEVVSRVIASPFFRDSRTVSCYLNMPDGEVDTSNLVASILQAGKTLYVPKIDVTVDGKMDFLKIYGAEDLRSLPSGTWGIKEPQREWQGGKRDNALEASSDTLDLILLPGVAFDHSLSRLGHGKGYYDRFISAYTSINGRKPLLVALALRPQILDDGKVPTGQHDWKMDVIVGPDYILTNDQASNPLSS
ncbi:5-formyltetrahydrofolate cyclo-ligase [Abortiporus biennis]